MRTEEDDGREGRSETESTTRGRKLSSPDDESVECDICRKIFKKKRYLRVHMGVHGSPRICHVCGLTLASVHSLEQHTRRHNRDYSVHCDVCHKGFYHVAGLKLHATTHTNVKSVACEICQRAFANRVYLRSHMRTHADPQTRKRYKCQICQYETFYRYCYKEHRESHTGEGKIACEACGKFVRRRYMRIHAKIHNGEKNDICEFCGKAFATRKHLTKHTRIHTGDRNFLRAYGLGKRIDTRDEELRDSTNFL